MPDLLSGPQLLVHEGRARANIERLAGRVRGAGLTFRPHFKTHQNPLVGQWFRDAGIGAITVSSPAMAAQFADAGWGEITIALPAQPGAVGIYERLSAQGVRLNLVVDGVGAVGALDKVLTTRLDCWLEIDAGYPRSGVDADDWASIKGAAVALGKSVHLELAGLLSHSGQTYACRGAQQVNATFAAAKAQMSAVRERLQEAGFGRLPISMGDTPAASLAEDFSGIDELRPGNFVFYDLMQAGIGACGLADIAVAAACPVIAKHPERGELILHGGAVHLSKEAIAGSCGGQVFGRIAEQVDGDWRPVEPVAEVVSISQEHGVVRGDTEWIRARQIGEVLLVLPVHSCLMVDCLQPKSGVEIVR